MNCVNPVFRYSRPARRMIYVADMSGATRAANERLSRLLVEVGWSPYDLARRINHELGAGYVHRTTPYTWCRLGTTPRPPLPSVVTGLLARAAGRPIRTSDLWPAVEDHLAVLPADQGLNVTGEDDWQARLPEDVESTMDSADLMCISGSSLLAFIRRWRPRNPSEPRARSVTLTDSGDDPILDHLAVSLSRLRTIDDRATGGALLAVVAHQQRLLAQLAVREGGASTTAYRYLELLAQHCQLAGWLSMDLGDQARAQRNFLLGLRLAQFVGDDDLASLIASCLAVQSLGRGALSEAHSLAQEATRGHHTPSTAAILWMRRGRMGAAVGDAEDADGSFVRAREFLDVADSAPRQPWAYWLTPEILGAERGRSLVDLGRPVRGGTGAGSRRSRRPRSGVRRASQSRHATANDLIATLSGFGPWSSDGPGFAPASRQLSRSCLCGEARNHGSQ